MMFCWRKCIITYSFIIRIIITTTFTGVGCDSLNSSIPGLFSDGFGVSGGVGIGIGIGSGLLSLFEKTICFAFLLR